MPIHWRDDRLRGRAGQEQRARRRALHPLCERCLDRGIIRPTDEIDHIIPVAMGGPDTDDNVQGLCTDCHKDKTAGEGANEHAAANHPEWLRPSAIPLTILCGPPASGKTTYVRERAKPGDIVIDLDTIITSIQPKYTHWSSQGIDRLLLNKAIRQRNSMLGSLSRQTEGRAWFIVAAPTEAERKWWAGKLGGTVVLLHPGLDECKRRALARGTPLSVQGIDNWDRRSLMPWEPRQPKVKGTTVDGRPRDPKHPWNRS